MSNRELMIVILAAGKGTRMKSDLPKVLHPIAAKPMLAHVLHAASAAGASRVAVVVGPGMDQVASEARQWVPAAEAYIQEAQNGTADAVLAARAAIESHVSASGGDVIVLLGDVPLVRTETIGAMRDTLDGGADIAVLGFRASDPTGYGRLLGDESGDLVAIREEKDASDDERRVDFCNSGVMAFRGPGLLDLLDGIGNNNANAEYYLTDVVEVGRANGRRCKAVEGSAEEVMGVNDRQQLAVAEEVFQRRARRAALLSGVSMPAPDTVWFAHDTKLGRDVVIEPHVFFGPGVSVADGVHIKGFSHIERTTIGVNAQIGPYARLRPGADIGEGARIGNFVEVKAATVEAGAKVNHLTYIGDARIGARANIGAGTITCNYDGYGKHRTDIGEGAFIGSNSSLVAPVRIGNGAYVGSGSVITKDVSDDALALERSAQTERAGWAARFRSLMSRSRKAG